jgi:hypothetical protein
MKNSTRIALLGLLCSAASQAAPFMAIGDSAELFVTGALAVRVDDNIYLEKNATDDVIFDITPGLELSFGKNSQIKGALTTDVAFTNYADNSNLNTTLFHSRFVSRFDDGKLKLGFNAGYNELNQNAPDIRGLTRRNVTSAGFDGEVEMTQVTSVGTGLAFTHDAYRRINYTNSDDYVVPLNVYYHFTPKVDLSGGYRYRSHEATRFNADLTSHFFNIGARGDFTPKLVGRFAVGGNETTPGLDSSLTYEFSPKTNLLVGATNDYDVSPQGQQQRNLTLNGLVTTKLSEEWSINGGLSWRSIKYPDRRDDYWEGSIGTAYVVNANVRISGTYTYRNYSSPLVSSEFKNNVFSISANLRY